MDSVNDGKTGVELNTMLDCIVVEETEAEERSELDSADVEVMMYDEQLNPMQEYPVVGY